MKNIAFVIFFLTNCHISFCMSDGLRLILMEGAKVIDSRENNWMRIAPELDALARRSNARPIPINICSFASLLFLLGEFYKNDTACGYRHDRFASKVIDHGYQLFFRFIMIKEKWPSSHRAIPQLQKDLCLTDSHIERILQNKNIMYVRLKDVLRMSRILPGKWYGIETMNKLCRQITFKKSIEYFTGDCNFTFKSCQELSEGIQNGQIEVRNGTLHGPLLFAPSAKKLRIPFQVV